MTQTLLATATPFFTALEMNNSCTLWQAQRALYDRDIRPFFEPILTGVSGFPQYSMTR